MLKKLIAGAYDLLKGGEVKMKIGWKKDLKKPIKVDSVLGTISSFPWLHVQVYLTDKEIPHSVYFDKESEDVIHIMNSGSQGTANSPSPKGLGVITDKLFLYYWAHNMVPSMLDRIKAWLCRFLFGVECRGTDFHTNVIVYYEEVES